MQFLSYAGDGIHRADSIFESDYRVVSRLSPNAFQQPQAAELHVRTLLTGAPLQRSPGRLCRREFLGYARQRLPPAESKRRTSAGTADESRGNGFPRFGLRCVSPFERPLSQAL